MGKVWVIAYATYHEAARQPIYYVLSISFSLLILLSNLTALFAFDDEGRMIREMGASSVVLCGILLSIVTSATVVTSELERRTALTVLSKPVKREQFLVGKYLGIVRANLLAFLLLTTSLIGTLWWHDGTEALEQAARAAHADPSRIWLFMRTYAVEQIVPAVACTFLGFLEVAVLSAVCVVMAFYFPMVVTGSVALGLYLLGHMSRFLFESFARLGPLAKLVGRVLYLLLPTLDAFNLSDYVAGGGTLSKGYLALTSLYAATYVAIVLSVGAALLSKKEIQ